MIRHLILILLLALLPACALAAEGDPLLSVDDLLSLEELKEKLAGNTEELKAVDLDLEKLARAAQLRSSAGEITRYYRREIQRFLELETVTNVDMRRLIDHITVSRDGNVHVVLRKFEDTP